MDKTFTFTRSDGFKFFYNGSLTVNVFDSIGGKEVDCFTLGSNDQPIPKIVEKMCEWVDYRKEEGV